MTKELFSVRDRIVVVTGGLGILGRQYTTCLLEHGARVCVFDAKAKGAVLPDGWRAAVESDQLKILSVDITRRAEIEAALQELIRSWGVPQALVNNAALDSPPHSPAEENGPFETYPENSWDRVMDVNVKGTFLCCQVVGGAMALAGRGSIVNISSTYGLVSPDQRLYEYRAKSGKPFYKPVAYSASKSAVLNLTRYLATYWAGKNVRVNTLTLGGVFNNQDEEFLRNYSQRVPLSRMAKQDEYDGAILFLVSDASSYMTGSNLVIDGGWTAW